MNCTKDNRIIINGGPFIVTTNLYGGIIKNYGWASLQIENFNNHTLISILCNNSCEHISNLLVHSFCINGIITPKLYQNIGIMLQRGYDALYAYNFSKLDTFKRECESYFKNLDYKL